MFENTNLPWLDTNTILLAYGGSTAYGTRTESSDFDYRGICIPPISYFYGLENFTSYEPKKQDKDCKEDIVIYSLQRWTHLAIQNNPNVLEILFTNPEHFIIKTLWGQSLIDIRYWFLSKQFFMRSNGYAKGQYKEMVQNGGKPTHGQGNPERMAMREKVGYDAKAFSHLLRIEYEAIEVLETGNLNIWRPERELLTNAKLGKFTFNEAIEMYQELDVKLYNAYKNSQLPEKPDFNKINKFIIELTKEYLRK
jgi:predicted nucleotidyltransferase